MYSINNIIINMKDSNSGIISITLDIYGETLTFNAITINLNDTVNPISVQKYDNVAIFSGSLMVDLLDFLLATVGNIADRKAGIYKLDCEGNITQLTK